MYKSYKKSSLITDKEAFFIGPNFLSGNIVIEKFASIWPGVVARADVDEIKIGKYTNIQDNVVLHCDYGRPLSIGNYVTVGHSAVVHGCQIGDFSLIGIGAIVLSGAVIEDYVLLGAGSLVPENKILRKGKLYVGTPAKFVRDLTEKEIENLKDSALHYVEIAKNY